MGEPNREAPKRLKREQSPLQSCQGLGSNFRLDFLAVSFWCHCLLSPFVDSERGVGFRCDSAHIFQPSFGHKNSGLRGSLS